MFRMTLTLLPAIAIATTAAAQESAEKKKHDPVAAAALETSAKALKAVERVRYDIDYLRTAWLTERVPAVTGTVTLGPVGEYDVPRFFAEIVITPHEGDAVKVTAGCNGDEYYIIDPATKKAHQDMDPSVMGSQARNVQRVLMEDFTSKEPLNDFFDAPELALLPQETVNGERCLVVEATAEGGNKMRIAMAERDGLPRRYQRFIKNRSGEVGEIAIVLSNLKVNPPLPKDAFLLKVPIGYTKSTDFAP